MQDLTQKRSEWWDARLENWALYRYGTGETFGAIAISSAYADVGGGRGNVRRVETVVPAVVGDAMDTDRLVIKLSDSQQNTLRVRYSEKGTQQMMAQSLGISPSTLIYRVNAAKVELEQLYWLSKSLTVKGARK